MSQRAIPSDLRALVAEQSRYRCSYCLTQESIAGTRFTVDHIIPQSLGGLSTPENLCLACWECNLIKQNRIAAPDPETGEMTPFFHPNKQSWHEHFVWREGGILLAGNTAVGRTTVVALRLNRPQLINARQRWVAVDWHPPED